MEKKMMKIGWASTDLTPEEPVVIAGQFHARVSEGVMDPVTATALALESGGGRALLVSCDLVAIPDALREAVRARAADLLPGLDSRAVCLFATHTHAAPGVRAGREENLRPGAGDERSCGGLDPAELGVMKPSDYLDFAVERIVAAVVEAWQGRAPGGIGFGLGRAVVGRNRRVVYAGGEARMYGDTADPGFSHIEGCEDHDLNLLCTCDAGGRLTGLAVNLACPAQVSEQSYLISADFWHDVRVELRARFGQGLFILPQCSAAGDQSPHLLLNRAAEARMLRLKGLAGETPGKPDSNLGAPQALRREIAVQVADGVSAVLPSISREMDYSPRLDMRVETIEVTRNDLDAEDVREAREGAAGWAEKYEALRADLEAHPERKKEPRWYVEITRAWSRRRWFENVEKRFEEQEKAPRAPVEITVLRLGEVALATNPFEYYLDFAQRIRARSPAVQTFIVQLAGTGTYVPTARATAGKSYGAVPASNPIGPEGGQEVVEHTLAVLAQLWKSRD